MNKKPLFIVFLTVFIDLIGFGMIIPLSPYLAQEFGADAFQVGLLMAIYSGFQFLMAPIWGQLSDKWGRRPIILTSLCVAGFSHILFGLAGSLWVLFLARALAGVGGANISTAMAYISDVTESKDRSKGMGLIGAAFGLGFVVGPALGGFFGQWSFALPAYVAGGICLANFVMAYFFLPESLKPNSNPQAKTNRFARIFRYFKDPKVGPLMMVSFGLSLALANIEAPLFLLVEDRFRWDLSQASYGFAFLGILMAFTQGVLIRKLLPIFGEMKLILVGSSFFAFALILTGWSYELLFTAIAMVFLAVGSGFYNPSLLGLVSLNSSDETQGEAMGVMQSLSALARIIGPPLGGWLYQSQGTATPFYFGSGVAFIGFGYMLLRFSKHDESVSTASSSKVGSTERDFQKMGLFQLENIVNNSVPYEMFLIAENGKDEAFSSRLFHKAQVIVLDGAIEHIQSKVSDKNYPIIIVGGDIQQIKSLAVSLEAQNYLNVYYLDSIG